jgi:hypothetical protein
MEGYLTVFAQQSALLDLFLWRFISYTLLVNRRLLPTPVESKPMKRGVLRLHVYSYTYISIVHRTEHNTAIYHTDINDILIEEGGFGFGAVDSPV